MKPKLIKSELANFMNEEVIVPTHHKDLRKFVEKPKGNTEEENKSSLIADEIQELSNIKLKIQNDIEDLSDIYKKTIEENNKEAEKIIELANQETIDLTKRTDLEAKTILTDSQIEAQRIKEKAEAEALSIINNAELEKEKIQKEALAIGKKEAYEKAYEQAKEEIESMKKLLEKLFQETINKRNEIVSNCESQLVDIAVLIAKKVVKKIIKEDEETIVRNVEEAIKKIKGAIKITIRVNTVDLPIIQRYKSHFYTIVGNLKQIDIIEDITLEAGGCIVETDMGIIDAQIRNQLEKIETAINKIQPIQKPSY